MRRRQKILRTESQVNLVQQMIFFKCLEITNTVQYSNIFETVFKKITHTINDYSFTCKQDGTLGDLESRKRARKLN